MSVADKDQHFDFIIAGAGCAGLSLVLHLIHSGKFKDKRILIVDRDLKKSNDRTWCFWEVGEGLFEPVVAKTWDHLYFNTDSGVKPLDISSYRYKMIRGRDFYEYCFYIIQKQKNITIIFEEVKEVFSNNTEAGVVLQNHTFYGKWIFNSILFEKPALSKKDFWMLQHFKGWVIETEKPVFEQKKATLMDFRVGQKEGTTFCYVLPLTNSRALVEYTLFSSSLLEPAAYDSELRHYIQTYISSEPYTIVEEEFGIIPMTNYKFPRGQGQVINIGTAGGQTKGSSGYTFSFIQKHSKNIVSQLERMASPLVKSASGKFLFYDSVLLRILANNVLPGKYIFERLFEKNKAAHVLKFLDNETNIFEDLEIISSLPIIPFAKAAIRHLR